MAVALDFSYLQSNDNTTIQITDSTAEYDASTNTGGWGSPNELVSDVVAETISTVGNTHLFLSITYTDSSNVETTYDDIDLYTEFILEFTKDYGMVFPITMANLKVDGIAEGTSNTIIPDGIYYINYVIKDATTDAVIYSKEVPFLVYGVVQNLVYALQNSSYSEIYKYKQFNADERDWQDILEPLSVYSNFINLITDNSEYSIPEKLEILYFLEQNLN